MGYKITIIIAVAALALAVALIGCNEDMPAYQGRGSSSQGCGPGTEWCEPLHGCADIGSCSTSAAKIDSNITDFRSCLDAGYPVRETDPRQCATPDGRVFTEESCPKEKRRCPEGILIGRVGPSCEFEQCPSGCRTLCGDGKCQEIVCQAIGCPCAETSANCPEDCQPGIKN